MYLRLTTQSQAGLVSEALDKFLPFERVLKYCIYRVQHGPASHTVPVEDIVLSQSTLQAASRPKGQDLGWLVQTSMRRCLSATVD